MNHSHEIDYRIHGDDLQTVEVELDPHETVVAEAGAMNWMEEDIVFETRMGDGSEANQGVLGKLFGAGNRMLTGESLFMTHFTNRGAMKRNVAFAAPYPGKIVPVDLASLGGDLICQKDAFLCAAKGTSVSMAFNRKLGAGFFGGEGFILQKLEGRGLSALMADIDGDIKKTPDTTLITSTNILPIEKVIANPDQPRQDFNKDDLEDLTRSIASRGIIQPIIVRLSPENNELYQIVAGERRWRAAQKAQLHEVPVVVRDFTDEELLEVAIIENVQRSNLNPLEEALGGLPRHWPAQNPQLSELNPAPVVAAE